MNFGHRKADGRKIYDCIETDCRKLCGDGQKKAELPVSHMLILGFFAGMFIALAGAGASVASAAMTNASASRIASALVFPAGLALVVCTGAELSLGTA